VIGFRNWNEGEHPTRLGGIFKMPNGEWMAMLAGTHGDFPPTDWDAWCAFGRSVRHGPFGELMADVTPVAEPVRYRLPTARRWRYELLGRFPDGVLPIGDAVAFYNPLYGQGMSAAAGECRALQMALDARAARAGSLDGLAAEYFPLMADWVRTAWTMACAADFQSPGCTGELPVDDLPDLERLTQLSRSRRLEDRQLALDIATLRRPLSALSDR
jgi:2-polyprenyl-6-methoxyphenol hydroxylase-like FAD-dependent oxidoreductase